jgi:hypothetical protein
MFGALIAEFMDAENTMWGTSAEGANARERIRAALRKDGLSYSRGGQYPWRRAVGTVALARPTHRG